MLHILSPTSLLCILAACCPVMATDIELQTQIYVLSGVFGGILLVLGLLIMGLSIAVGKMSTELKPSPRYQPEVGPAQDNRGYAQDSQYEDRPQVRKMAGEDELTEMGFEIYSGQPTNRPQSSPRKPDLDRGISVQSDFFRGGDEDFYDRAGQQGRYGHQGR
eukprot:TRINITY_DN69070_c0_g1_i1.p1 TRINITY_DN69070_c0_g1~~TRINITY_DN69070_c0_g1_i1.p1  ORF type:complete len:162 (-),score=29.33 TRINITY_DN69070_c0_g1_i1:38-523(-)